MWLVPLWCADIQSYCKAMNPEPSGGALGSLDVHYAVNFTCIKTQADVVSDWVQKAFTCLAAGTFPCLPPDSPALRLPSGCSSCRPTAADAWQEAYSRPASSTLDRVRWRSTHLGGGNT
jgi:hypothetical protein